MSCQPSAPERRPSTSPCRPRQYLVEEHAYPGRQPHWYETSVGPVVRGGTVVSLILVSRDITTRLKAGTAEDGPPTTGQTPPSME